MGGPWEDYAAPTLPRGLRNNNPGNIEDGDFARSIPGYNGSDGRFAVYDSLDSGKAAHMALLGSYGRKGINTVEGVVSRWAPPSENNTGAYVKFVSQKLGVDPRAPLDMNNPQVLSALAEAQAEHENGRPLPASDAPPWVDYGGQGDAPAPVRRPPPLPGQPGAPPVLPRPVAAAPKPQTSERLGFEQGFTKPFENIGNWAVGAADRLGYEPADWVKTLSGNLKAAQQGVEAKRPEIYQAKPGAAGQFAGNVLGTSWIPGGPLVQGAASGALLSDQKNLGGVATDAAIGGVTGRLAAGASDALQIGARKLLSKAPQIMDLPALEQAVKAAYAKVDASGFRISTADVKGLSANVMADLRAKGGPKGAKLYPDADAFASRLDALSKQKGGVSVTQLDQLRSDIFDAMIKPGGKEAGVGKAIRAKIDGLIDSIPNGDIKAARELYTRLSKTRTVANRLEAADLQAGRAYTGKNTNNAIRQKLSPLVDPTSGKRIANATPDEAAALRKAVVGSKGQNLVRTAGTLLDPRGMIGMGLQLGGAAKTAGLSAASIPLGFIATAAGNRMSQNNVQELLRLIAAGGSKQALKPVPTAASQAVETAIARVGRPALVASSVPALAAARRNSQTKAKK